MKVCKFHIVSKQTWESEAPSGALINHSDSVYAPRTSEQSVGPQRKGPAGCSWDKNCKHQTSLQLFIPCSVLCWLGSHGVLLPHPDRKALTVPDEGWEPAPCRDGWPPTFALGSLCTRQREEAVFPEKFIDGVLSRQVLWCCWDPSWPPHPAQERTLCYLHYLGFEWGQL
jgi:hypothetical protein